MAGEGGGDGDDKDGATHQVVAGAVRAVGLAVSAKAGVQQNLFGPEPLPDDDQAGTIGPRSKGGRPPGAQNVMTNDMRRFVRATLGDPMQLAAGRAMADPKALSRELGLPIDKVVDMQTKLLTTLLPYFHSQMPAQLRVEGKGALAVMMMPGGSGAGDDAIEGSFVDFDDLERQARAFISKRLENQGVTDVEAEPANAAPSNATPESNGESDG